MPSLDSVTGAVTREMQHLAGCIAALIQPVRQARSRVSERILRMAARYSDFVRDYSRALSSRASGLSRPASAHFLVISDLHGANRFDLVKAVLDSEFAAGRGVSAVLVLGDLANFGFPLELGVRRFRTAIARLRVPVLMILGNHDKHGPTDTSVARYLSKIPNAMLMQTGPDYRFANFGSVRVGGFDDPRYFGDDNTGNAKKQVPAREAFLHAARDEGGVPDIIMVHEPYAAGPQPALWLNGHMHSPKLDPSRNQVQVGMLTDGVCFYNRKSHRRAPSNFVLLAARSSPEETSAASVSFRWKRGVPGLTRIDTAEFTPWA